MMVLTDRLCKKVKVSVYKVHFRIKFCSLIFKAYKDGVIYSFHPNSPINGLRQWIEKQNKLLRLSMLLNVTTHKRAAKMRLIYSYLLLNLINDILNQVELLLQAINGPVKTKTQNGSKKIVIFVPLIHSQNNCPYSQYTCQNLVRLFNDILNDILNQAVCAVFGFVYKDFAVLGAWAPDVAAF